MAEEICILLIMDIRYFILNHLDKQVEFLVQVKEDVLSLFSLIMVMKDLE